MSAETNSQNPPSPSLLEEIREVIAAIPNKGLFAVVLALWLGLFHFLGNAVFGYVDTGSLLYWMYWVFRTTEDDQHGLLIPFVVLVLLWWKREELLRLEKRPWYPAIGLVGFGLVLHVVGYAVQQSRISIVGFFVGLYGLTGLVWGKEWLKATFFPMFLFGFCVPISSLADVITVPLRMLVSRIAVGIANGALGMALIREGSQIFNEAHTFQFDVAAPCSGIRSLIALFALSTIYGFVTFKSWWKRMAMIVCAIPLAIAANVVRVTVVLIVNEAFGIKAATAIEQRFGFVTFAISIGATFLIARLLRGKSETLMTEPTPQPA